MKLRQLVDDGLRYFHVQYDEQIVADILYYVKELEKWNRHVNLTGLRNAEEVVRALLYDAFFVDRFIKGDRTVLDLGSGAGILAVPLKVLNSGMSVISVDKNMKKIQFQRHIARGLRLKDFTALHGKIEELDAMEVDALLVKAFGSMKVIFEKGGRHIRREGRALMLKTDRDEPAEAAGFVLEDSIPYRLPLSEKALRIFIYKKIS